MKNKDWKENNRRSKIDVSQLVYGKVPPQAISCEMSLLGVMILFPDDTIMDVRMILKPEDFYVDGHQHICRALYEMKSKHERIDMVTVAEWLMRKGQLEVIGGPYYIARCTNDVTAPHQFHTFCKIIKQYSIARKLIAFSAVVMNKAYSDDPFDALETAEMELYQIFEEIKETQVNDLSVLAFNAARHTLTVRDEKDWVVTGFPQWDKINGPLTPNLYVIAARPGMGKTAKAIELAKRMGQRYPIGFINGEMSDTQIVNRLVCSLAELSNEVLKKRPQDWTDEEQEKYHHGMQLFLNLKLHIFSESMDIEEVCNMITFYVKKFGCKAIILDYLQIASIPAELQRTYNTDVLRITYCINRLRALAKKLGVPIFVLSQLNRENTKRANFRPTLSDLKGAGAIEEAAFQIMFLHRPEYYGITEDDMGESTKNLLYEYIDKHRDGALDTIKQKFLGPYSQILDWQNEYAGWNPMEAVRQESQFTYTIMDDSQNDATIDEPF